MRQHPEDDRPKWTGPDNNQRAEWRGMLLEVTRLDDKKHADGWVSEQWRFRVTGGPIPSKYSHVVEFACDARHCAEGAARDYSAGVVK